MGAIPALRPPDGEAIARPGGDTRPAGRELRGVEAPQLLGPAIAWQSRVQRTRALGPRLHSEEWANYHLVPFGTSSRGDRSS